MVRVQQRTEKIAPFPMSQWGPWGRPAENDYCCTLRSKKTQRIRIRAESDSSPLDGRDRSPHLIPALPGETAAAAATERKTAGSHARCCCCSHGENVRGWEASVIAFTSSFTVSVGPSWRRDPDHRGWWWWWWGYWTKGSVQLN